MNTQTMPKAIKYFEWLFLFGLGGIFLSIVFESIFGPDNLFFIDGSFGPSWFYLVYFSIILLLLFLTSRKRSNIAKWLLVALVAFNVILFAIRMLDFTLGYVSWSDWKPWRTFFAIFYISAFYFLFSTEGRSWFPVKKKNTKSKDVLPESTNNSTISDKDFVPTMLLCFFLGGLGMHRFFVGKTGTGILMLLTIGGLGIWWIIDLIMIAMGSFKDIHGRAIIYQSTNTANTAPSTHVPGKVEEAPPAKDIPAEIEKLADLKDKGIITDEEFQQKKQELLERI